MFTTECSHFERGGLPILDGEVNRYSFAGKGLCDMSSLVYVNGINTSAHVHRFTCNALSYLTSRPVQGVFNQSSGTARDLIQCLGDMQGRRLSGLVEFQEAMEDLIRNPTGPTRHLLDQLLDNQATAALRKLIESRLRYELSVDVLAHSQGCYIVRNALLAYGLEHGHRTLQKIRVWALAPPVAWDEWPPGSRVTPRRFVFDVIQVVPFLLKRFGGGDIGTLAVAVRFYPVGLIALADPIDFLYDSLNGKWGPSWRNPLANHGVRSYLDEYGKELVHDLGCRGAAVAAIPGSCWDTK